MTKFRKTLQILWVTFGILFTLWMANSFRAHGVDQSILESDEAITVEETNRLIAFRANLNQQPVALIFFPGGLVQPEAYAPMARAIAEQGYDVFILKLPLGSALFASQEEDVMQTALDLMNENKEIQTWVVGGHSRGAAIASRFAYSFGEAFDGLILIGTSHPKESAFSLVNTKLYVTKIYASNDGLASMQEVEANAIYLPTDTNFVLIEGGNHSQFGYYGNQLGDNSASITREEQQAQTVNAILSTLKQVQAEKE